MEPAYLRALPLGVVGFPGLALGGLPLRLGFFEMHYLDDLEVEDEAVLEAVGLANVQRDFEHWFVACLAEVGLAEGVLVAVRVPH